jgi:2-C-methyl-D-erythritol 4-phosphate cytidylyltransferase
VVVVLSLNDPYWPTVASRLPDVTVATRASEPSVAAALIDATRAAERHAPPAPKASDELELGDARFSMSSTQTIAVVKLPQVVTATGGTERSQSVRNGLAALSSRASAGDWVLVHDAARPCLSRQDVDRLLEIVQHHAVGGLLAAPATDTLKRAGAGREVSETVDRAGLWRALTPQMFRYGRLCDALDGALAEGRLPTDEAQALEWVGAKPVVVEGSTTNIKITSADDLVIAMALMGAVS